MVWRRGPLLADRPRPYHADGNEGADQPSAQLLPPLPDGEVGIPLGVEELLQVSDRIGHAPSFAGFLTHGSSGSGQP